MIAAKICIAMLCIISIMHTNRINKLEKATEQLAEALDRTLDLLGSKES